MKPGTLEAYLERLEREPARASIARRPRGRGEAVAASYAQRHLWLHARLAPDEPVYSEPITIHRDGPLHVGALERALGEVLRRHEAWRTTFTAEGGDVFQIVHETFAVHLPVHDLRDLPGPEREAEALRLATEDALRPFDLARGPLVRARLVRMAEDRHRLYLALHHVVFDGVSIYRVLLPELAALYEAFAAGQPSPLAEPPIQYADFAAWQREWAAGDAARLQLDYWTARLAGSPPEIALPLDRARPAAQTFAGAMHRLLIPVALADALKAVGRRLGATFYMTVLAAFAALLQRYSRQDDLVIGSVTAGRKRPEVERLLGYFLNPLALRLDLSGDPTFAELVGRVRDVALDALAHDEVPFEHVVAAVRPDRDPGRNPLFQVMFSLEPPLPALPPGWRLTQLDVEVGTAKMDLYLELDDRPEGVIGRFVYRTDLFEAATIERMARHFLVLLESAAREPEQRVSELAMLTPPERHRILVDWNATARPYPADGTVHGAFESQVQCAPQRIALVHRGRTLTYAELDRRANALARRLRRLGVGPDRLVAVIMERSPEMIVAMLGTLKAGGGYVPLDPGYPRERLAFLVGDCDAVAVLTQRRLLERLPASRPSTLFLDAGSEARGEAAPRPAAGSTADHLAYAIYTSGSTGQPKGAAISHRAVLRLLFDPDYVALGPDEVVMFASSVAFDVSVFEIWAPLLHGGRLVLFPERVPTPAALRHAIRRERVTTMWLTASVFNTVIEAAPDALAGLRQLIVGGEALSVPHVRRAMEALPDTRIVNGYGPTETCVFACAYPIAAPPPPGAASVPIGRPIPNTRVYVLDGRGVPAPIDVPGELHIGGPGVARGYLGRPELTAEKFVPDPFGAPGDRLYRSGDLARWREDGTLEFLGRMDAQLKIRGFRVEPGEIERTLEGHPAVRHAAVVAFERAGAPALAAYVVARAGARPELDELRRFLAERLPGHMVPSAFVALESLPLTGSGKLDRRSLPSPDPPAEARAVVLPRDPLEAGLVRIWEDLLGIGTVGVTENFFDLGGSSLLAVRLVQRIEDMFGRTLPVAALYARPTVEALAAALAGDDCLAAPIVTLNGGGARAPLFFFHGDLGGGGFYSLTLARHLGAEQPVHVVHPLGLRDNAMPPVTIEAMAEAHVAALRRLQARGPYRLGGYCNGGMVAFETARRLEGLGERVESIALIAALPDTRLGWLRPALDVLPRRGREHGLLALGRARGAVDRLARARGGRAAATAANGGGPRLDLPARYPALYRAYFSAVRAYVPRPCAARLLVLWPAAEPAPAGRDGSLGWGRLAPIVEVQVVPGDHNTIVTEHAPLVAEWLAWFLA